MQLTIRKAADRGYTQTDWLQSWHSFSFGEYHDPQHMGFHFLRVINQDIVKPNRGFATHSHHDMEIITYVLRGAIEHKDSMGNQSIIKPGEVQAMSAGTGVRHSEHNPSTQDELELLQIWILPNQKRLTPRYQQIIFEQLDNQVVLLGSPDGGQGSIQIHQHVHLYRLALTPGQTFLYSKNFLNKPYAWLQVCRGRVIIAQQELSTGDGLAIHQPSNLTLVTQDSHCELLVFEME